MITGRCAFPGRVVFYDHFAATRMMESQLRFAPQAIDDEIINEQFPPRSNLGFIPGSQNDDRAAKDSSHRGNEGLTEKSPAVGRAVRFVHVWVPPVVA